MTQLRRLCRSVSMLARMSSCPNDGRDIANRAVRIMYLKNFIWLLIVETANLTKFAE